MSIYAAANNDGNLGHALVQVTSNPRSDLSDVEWRLRRIPEAAVLLAGLAAEEVAGFGRSSDISDFENLAFEHGREAVNSCLPQDLPL
jgi:hypothetical protein